MLFICLHLKLFKKLEVIHTQNKKTEMFIKGGEYDKVLMAISDKARVEIGYSESTWWKDISWCLYIAYKKGKHKKYLIN